jgi:hypothetical protein
MEPQQGLPSEVKRGVCCLTDGDQGRHGIKEEAENPKAELKICNSNGLQGVSTTREVRDGCRNIKEEIYSIEEESKGPWEVRGHSRRSTFCRYPPTYLGRYPGGGLI